MRKNTIYFIFCYARSGGTLLNKYLNSIPDLVVLSEVHPIHNKKGGIYSVKNQAKEWYGIDVKSDNYLEQIIEVEHWCEVNNKYLIIRDWSYIDFTKSYLNDYNPPKKSINLSLLETNFHVNKIIFIRDSIDVFLSTDLILEDFSYAYFSFINYTKSQGVEFFKYEDFIEDEYSLINKILHALSIELELSRNLNVTIQNNSNVVGDLNPSRGNSSKGVVKLKRKYANLFKIKQINNNDLINQINQLFGYSPNYHSREHESLLEYIKFEFKKKKLYIKKVITILKRKL